jgi:hypothetical protein
MNGLLITTTWMDLKDTTLCGKGQRDSKKKKKKILTQCQWLAPVILATQEAEIRRISV